MRLSELGVALAGGLLAYAAMVRVFPGAFLFGPAVIALHQIVTKRSLPAWSRRLGAGFVLPLVMTLVDVVEEDPKKYTPIIAYLPKLQEQFEKPLLTSEQAMKLIEADFNP